MKKIFAAFLLAAVVMSMHGLAQATVINGGFETGDLTGWSSTGSVGVVSSDGGVVPVEGSYMGDEDPCSRFDPCRRR